MMSVEYVYTYRTGTYTCLPIRQWIMIIGSALRASIIGSPSNEMDPTPHCTLTVINHFDYQIPTTYIISHVHIHFIKNIAL